LDITSPSSLWKDYDVTALPFNEYALSEKTDNGICIREFYFDGHVTVDGRVRAFMRISENPSAKGVILFVPSVDAAINANAINNLYSRGYTVAVLDYLGKSDDIARYTLYPRSLDICNSRGCDVFKLAADAQYSRWYMWTCIARRAVKLLKKLYDADVFALGIGLGGCTVYKLAAFDDGIKACATLLNINPQVSGSGNEIINYHASLDNLAYATLCKLPLFMGVASNDEDGSLDKMSELADETASLKCFRIIERSFRCGINNIYGEVIDFFENYQAPILTPEIKASNSEGNLYFNITISSDDSDLIQNSDNLPQYDLDLYVAFCIEDARYRNWMKLSTINLGENGYISHINVCQSEKPIYAFANITLPNDDGTTARENSSVVFNILPKTLGIKSKPGVSHRKIYDSSMGKDGWIARNGEKVYLKKGPYDIEGVTSDNGSLITFKPGDPLFKVPTDTLLQIMVCGKPQTLTVTVKDMNYEYSCQVDIKTSDDWYKFSLAHHNFKGQNGTLVDWSQILVLEFSSDESFTIDSVIWV